MNSLVSVFIFFGYIPCVLAALVGLTRLLLVAESGFTEVLPIPVKYIEIQSQISNGFIPLNMI